MKVKVIVTTDSSKIEELINDFINNNANIEICSVNVNSCYIHTKYTHTGEICEQWNEYIISIIYKEF